MDIFETLYDNLVFNRGFAEDLYYTGVYTSVGILMIISSFVWMLLYYYFISNFMSFYKLSKWYLWILILSIVNFCVGYYFSELTMFKRFLPDDYPYLVTDFINFSFVNVFWTIIFCFAFSLVLKIKSTCASKTPF